MMDTSRYGEAARRKLSSLRTERTGNGASEPEKINTTEQFHDHQNLDFLTCDKMNVTSCSKLLVTFFEFEFL